LLAGKKSMGAEGAWERHPARRLARITVIAYPNGRHQDTFLRVLRASKAFTQGSQSLSVASVLRLFEAQRTLRHL
jgi:hypothetical protein